MDRAKAHFLEAQALEFEARAVLFCVVAIILFVGALGGGRSGGWYERDP